MIIRLSENYIVICTEEDKYILENNKREISNLLNNEYDFCLLTQYVDPPIYSVRYDGEVSICLLNRKLVEEKELKNNSLPVKRIIYQFVTNYLNEGKSFNYEIVQLGKLYTKKPLIRSFSDSSVVIPHKGKLSLLDRCISHLQNSEAKNISTKIIFDSHGYKKFYQSDLNKRNISIFKNSPLGLGPYLGRHYSITQSDSINIFFQDSDDLSLPNRFSLQLDYMAQKDLDMVGCHELRIDQFTRTIKLVRFPIDVTHALNDQASHPLFHPTALVKKAKYIESGGFSLNRKFASDTQFLLRAHFNMRIGNVDEFLYIRFKRQNSLTTNKISNLNTNIRKELDSLWKDDFASIKKGEMQLNNSSLKFENFNGSYALKKINYR